MPITGTAVVDLPQLINVCLQTTNSRLRTEPALSPPSRRRGKAREEIFNFYKIFIPFLFIFMPY